MNSTSEKQAWDTLRDEFQGTVEVQAIELQTLRRDFKNLRMKDGEFIKDFSSRVIKVVNQIKAYCDNIMDQRAVKKILISLTENFDSMVSIIEELKDLSKLSITELGRKNKKGKGIPNNSKEGEKKGKYPPCGVCKRTNHLEKDCWHKGKPQCKICKRFGHTDQTCRLKQNQRVSVAETEEEEEDQIFYACQAAMTKKDDVWLIDSCCTNHMAKDQSFFTHLDATVKVSVRIGHGALVESKGKDTVAFQTNKGTGFIKDVLYVPGLDQNLLSIP
ncbi:uncharacterized protein LOC131162883 [Malania oleifera]|uniref:uncharacterized protein LOC131162883 n=1 Tax=Malania oleifera TaxID=397392 RepID=UPI0025AE09A1|nr:uncharacterized protein LOC131162883 [Malania oleifera]